MLAAAQSDICAFLDIPEPERFLFTPGCTAALALAIGDLPWQPGDEVVTSALEHHALTRPVDALVRHRGVRHSVAPYSEGTPIDLDFVRARLEGGRVRVVATTAASNVTGELLPIHELAELAHRYGALYLMDAAQTVGVVPLSVADSGADILAFAGHKGPLGPQGIGGFWASSKVAFESPAAVCEIAEARRSAACSPFPSYCDTGGLNVAGAVGLAAGLRWLRDAAVEPGLHARGLSARLEPALRERTGCRVYGAAGTPRTAALSLRIDALPLERCESFFAERGVWVRAGHHCAPMAVDAIGAGEGTLRISFGPFSAEDDVEVILDAIDSARASASST